MQTISHENEHVNNDARQRYRVLSEQQRMLQGQKANCELDLKLYALHSEFYSEQTIAEIRQQYYDTRIALERVVKDIDALLEADATLRTSLARDYQRTLQKLLAACDVDETEESENENENLARSLLARIKSVESEQRL